MKEGIGVVGAGLMGSGIARQLAKDGYRVTAFKRNPQAGGVAVEEMRSDGVSITSDLQGLLRSVDIIATCLPTSDIVETVLLGPDGLGGVQSTDARLVLDFTTALPRSTVKIAASLEKRGIEMLDTPMGGGPAQAAAGKLKIIVGGKREVFVSALPLLKVLAEPVVYGGPSGSGHTLKLVNNFMGILNQVVAAAVSNVLEDSGIDRETLIEFISSSGGNSWGFQDEMDTVQRGDFSLRFAMELAEKDMRYAKEFFDDAGLRFSILDELVATFAAAGTRGYSKKDVRSIYLFYQEMMQRT